MSSITPKRLTDLLSRIILFLLPSFLTSSFSRTGGSSKVVDKQRYTAYFDGLRGIAAWAVFNAHLSAILTKSAGSGWGGPELGSDAPANYQIWKLPVVRLLYSGEFAVPLFFVISGFALSISPVMAMRTAARDPATAMHKLSSSILRRPLRLLLPAWASMLIVFCLLRMHYFDFFFSRRSRYTMWITGWPLMDVWPTRDESFLKQLDDLIKCCMQLLRLFETDMATSFAIPYNRPLWTVMLEFRASLVLFVTHAGVYFLDRDTRTAVLVVLIVLGTFASAFEFPIFWAGYLLAEYTPFSAYEAEFGLGTDSRELIPLSKMNGNGYGHGNGHANGNGIGNGHSVHTPIERRKKRSVPAFVWLALLFLGLFVGSVPSFESWRTPYYHDVLTSTPWGYERITRFWNGIGAILTVWAISRLAFIRSFLTTPVINYLGKISFAMYLVHFWIIHTLAPIIFYTSWRITGKNQTIPQLNGWAMGYMTLLFITVWVADVFWRAVDRPLVAMSYRLQKGLFTQGRR